MLFIVRFSRYIFSQTFVISVSKYQLKSVYYTYFVLFYNDSYVRKYIGEHVKYFKYISIYIISLFLKDGHKLSSLSMNV